MARQNLRLLGLGVCMFSVLAVDELDMGDPEPVHMSATDPTRPQFTSCSHLARMGKPRPGSSDGPVDFLTEFISDRQEPGRRTGIVTKVQPRGLSIMVRYPNAGEEVKEHVHTRDRWSFEEYFQKFRFAIRGDKPIKGDIVKFTVIDASDETRHETSQNGRVKAVEVVKIGHLTIREREQLAQTHGYEMSHERSMQRRKTCPSISGPIDEAEAARWEAARSEVTTTTSASSNEDATLAAWFETRQSGPPAQRESAPVVTQEQDWIAAAAAYKRDQVPMSVRDQMRQPMSVWDQTSRGNRQETRRSGHSHCPW